MFNKKKDSNRFSKVETVPKSSELIRVIERRFKAGVHCTLNAKLGIERCGLEVTVLSKINTYLCMVLHKHQGMALSYVPTTVSSGWFSTAQIAE